MSENVKIEESWKQLLHDEFEKNYFKQLKQFLVDEKKSGVKIFPPGSQIFAAFNQTPFEKVKVVLLGQDPYHGAEQAHGLCFSVNDGVKFPPSLQNIFKELKDDCGCEIPKSGNLIKWTEQGVLLLNATLTVKENEAGSHQNKGWEIFTDTVIKTISDKKENVVFILWGRFAKTKASLIDSNKHLILQSGHPSFADSHKQFFGCKHFSKTNNYLKEKKLPEINWQL